MKLIINLAMSPTHFTQIGGKINCFRDIVVVVSHLNEGELLFQFTDPLILLLQTFFCISRSLLPVRPTLSVGSCRVMFGKGIHSCGWVALVKDPLTIRVRVQVQHLRVKSLVSVLVDEESAGIWQIISIAQEW